MGKSRLILDVALVSVLGVAVLGATVALKSSQRDLAFFDPIIDVKHLIDTRFVDEVDETSLQTAAIAGMIGELDDPFTTYVPAEQVQDFSKSLTGEYVGIGAQISLRDGWLTIVSPLEDSPAFRVGLMPDDRVVAIEGETTFQQSIDQAIEKLTGDAGTPVTITIEREGERFDVEIIREAIKTRSIKGFHRDPADPERWLHTIDPDSSIAYIRITQFTPGVASEFAAALAQARSAHGPVRGLVLDVRSNPGGVLEEAAAIADMLLDGGTILKTRGRNRPESVFTAEPGGLFTEGPIVVLINGGSASASEILAGALKDNLPDRTVVLGTRTFGKGSVQNVLTLPSSAGGAQLKLTEQYYYLPSGKLVHRTPDATEWGVDPTDGFHLPLTNDDASLLFERRREQEVLRADATEEGADGEIELERWDDPAWIVDKLADPQLAAALDAITAKLATGEWQRTGEPLPALAERSTTELADARLYRERLLRDLERIEGRIEELGTIASNPDAAPAIDLWSDELSIDGGRVIITDREGKRVADLRVTNPNIERWFIDAGLEPVEQSDAPPQDGTR